MSEVHSEEQSTKMNCKANVVLVGTSVANIEFFKKLKICLKIYINIHNSEKFLVS